MILFIFNFIYINKFFDQPRSKIRIKLIKFSSKYKLSSVRVLEFINYTRKHYQLKNNLIIPQTDDKCNIF